MALATVFFFNAVALFIFPPLGRHFELTQMQFGVWSALAIHDTSSVVGAAMQYGARALEIATTIKLTRALWIVPVTLVIGMLWNRSSSEKGDCKAKRPWYILGFLAAAAIVTWDSHPEAFGPRRFRRRATIFGRYTVPDWLGAQPQGVTGGWPLAADSGVSPLDNHGKRYARRDPVRLAPLIQFDEHGGCIVGPV